MRPLRLLISLSLSVVTVVLLFYLARGPPREGTTDPSINNVKALFSFTSPGSLFPPSAIISLTDDNSTFFLARPAAFGPDLPKRGLSGPLWIGSGFTDDTMGKAGELGCSDVPGWSDGEGHGDNLLAHHSSEHADIQSMQESAEITGKVVLLKRGGCGFLAKVQWAQRRGGTAVIVGDDVRGGALVRMYAKGDTSNITIPSLFTSHTTAHLLSSLMPSQAFAYAQHASIGTKPEAKSTSRFPAFVEDKSTSQAQKRPGILHSFLSTLGLITGDGQIRKTGTRRLPGSGRLGWAELNPSEDDSQPIRNRPASSGSLPTTESDKFMIGKQDWRDPDLLPYSTTTRAASSPISPTSSPLIQVSVPIVPGSGEYISAYATRLRPKSLWSAWFDSNHRTIHDPSRHIKTRGVTSITGIGSTNIETSSYTQVAHEGLLWVTLTPTNVSTSPFFDTLLVLVISPLVTLTVVYVLLLLRSRIRRRRWRAPKSVVERLPVRTYHTISDNSSSATPSASSPTTPLLQHSPSQSISSMSSPWSDNLATSSVVPRATREREQEKRESGLAAWRRRYGGRQKECVVCLEEYVDGVSQVMSLPCGHEFHADCITPWLVTRRRTCPICKGDVVRSLSQSYHDQLRSPSPAHLPRFSGSGDDIQAQAAETRNDSQTALQPVPTTMLAPAAASPVNDVEIGWPGQGLWRSAGDASSARTAESSSPLRSLGSTVSGVIVRGFDVVRSTTYDSQRRSPTFEEIDRDR